MSFSRPHDHYQGNTSAPSTPLIVVGASVRAAVESARRAGLVPHAVDLFGDADTRELAEKWQPLDTTVSAKELLQTIPPAPVMVAGGSERWLDWLEPVRSIRPLLCPSLSSFQQLRDPAFLALAAEQSGFAYPPWQPFAPRDASGWLVKNRFSAGGCDVLAVDPFLSTGGASASGDGATYFQRRCAGTSWGACFLSGWGQATVLGIFRAFRCAIGPRRFLYAGSLGPWPAPRSFVAALTGLGTWLSQNTELRGLFGIDFLCSDPAGPYTLLEVNPRYTASMELLEMNGIQPLLGPHLAAFGDSRAKFAEQWNLVRQSQQAMPTNLFFKRIVWAGRDLSWDAEVAKKLLKIANEQPQAIPIRMADIPPEGTLVQRGTPLVTLLVGPIPPMEKGSMNGGLAEARAKVGHDYRLSVILESCVKLAESLHQAMSQP